MAGEPAPLIVRCLITGVTAMLALAGTAVAADEPLVLVARTVDTRYGQTAQANADFAVIVNSPLTRAVRIRPNDTLQGITSREFAIGPTSSPTEYSALSEKIKDLNQLNDVDSIAAGKSLIVPNLPPKQFKQASDANAYNSQPRIIAGPPRDKVANGSAFDLAKGAITYPNVIFDQHRPAAPFVKMWQWVPASVANADPTLQVIAQPILVKFSNAIGDAGDAQDIADDIQSVKTLATTIHQDHESMLYVLDDSWPSQEDFASSLKFLVSADAQIRASFHLGAAEWPQALHAAGVITSFPFDADGRGSHARKIVQSLAPFEAISSNVRITYIPLFVEQAFSKEILREILLVSFTADGKGQFLDANLTASALNDVIATARKHADEIIDTLPKVITGQPTNTDQAIINGVHRFAQLYALTNGAPFFLNASWTVQKHAVRFELDPDLLGVTLAAVGDDASTDVFDDEVLLASRAADFPGDVVAVVNAHPNGNRAGCSSFWRSTAEPIYALAYTGFLAGNICGSSFSAPRIGWMLAFRQSLQPLVPANSRSGWFANFRRFILTVQDPQKSGELRYWFSTKRAFPSN